MKPVSEKLLSPKYLTEADSSYESVKELTAAVTENACKNIAVTGIYGAGKSSVINTFAAEYEKNNPGKRILRISLSTFDMNDGGDEGDTSYENDIEYKLVQQILYRSNPDELYQSSFRRIHYRSYESIKSLTIHILISVAAFIVLFEPSSLRVESLYDLYFKILGKSAGEWVNKAFDIISIGWLAYEAYLIITWSIKRLSVISSMRFKAKDYEVELSKDSSVFSKMQEELYYFFRAGKYDVVIIEDLDRLKKPSNLFLKLRELNIMLNESYAFRSENKTLKFIYAVRDDLFDSEIRVKFFDYIVPVVPIIDTHNAADYIIEKRPDIYEGLEEFKQAIPEIALFVKEKRVLQNVLNEYELYYKTIFTKQSHLVESKLLAMIVYKNIWPDNYSLLHKRNSILNQLFDDPKQVVRKLYEKDVTRKDELEQEIATLANEAKKIRKDFVDYIESEYKVTQFKSDSVSYSLNDIIENDYLFIRLQQDKFEQYVFIDNIERETGTIDRDFTFEDIEGKIDVDGSKVLALSRYREELQRKEIEKAGIERKLAHLYASSYKEILADVDGDEALACIKDHVGSNVPDELSRFILPMLRKGYIAEDYHKYISFYYEGSISSKDSAFVNAVLQGSSLGFDYKLDNPKEIRKQLVKEDNYNGNSILNYSFIEYLMNNMDPYLDNVTKVARSNWKFIKECDLIGENNAVYLRDYVFKGWYDCLRSIFKGDKRNLSENLQLFFHYCPDNNPDASIKDVLSSMYDVVANGVTAASSSLVASWVTSKGIVFNSLRAPLTEHEKVLFEAVKEEGLFDITKQNTLVIFGKPYETASYTAIRNCGNERLIEFLESHIDKTVQTFPETSISEDEDNLKDLLNESKINREWKKAYLEKQSGILQNLEDLSEEAIEMVLQAAKVVVNWSNIYEAISGNANEALKAFITGSINELASQKCELENEKTLVVEKRLFSDNDYLTFENFSVLVSLFSVPMVADDLSELDNDRMLLMVQNRLVSFSESGLELLAVYRIPVIAQYVVNHFEEYKKLYDEHNEFCNNEFGLCILNSSLTDEQKTYYLDSMAPTKLEKDEFYHEYSKQICIFLNRVGLTDKTDIEMVVNALEGYNEESGWYDKISLINNINAKEVYDKGRETRMINALGGGYPQLNSYYGSLALDNNPQNKSLLDYLVANEHYVHRFYLQEDGRLKVTFKRDPNR